MDYFLFNFSGVQFHYTMSHVILNALLQNNRLTQKEIASKLEWSVDRVKYYLQKLKKKGVIKRVGSSHNGYWGIIVK